MTSGPVIGGGLGFHWISWSASGITLITVSAAALISHPRRHVRDLSVSRPCRSSCDGCWIAKAGAWAAARDAKEGCRPLGANKTGTADGGAIDVGANKTGTDDEGATDVDAGANAVAGITAND